MFRIIPERALIEPKARLASVDGAGRDAIAVLRIEGLVCSACAGRVRRHLGRVDGVEAVLVDLDASEARVAYDPARTEVEALGATVEGAVLFRPLRRLIARLAS